MLVQLNFVCSLCGSEAGKRSTLILQQVTLRMCTSTLNVHRWHTLAHWQRVASIMCQCICAIENWLVSISSGLGVANSFFKRVPSLVHPEIQ